MRLLLIDVNCKNSSTGKIAYDLYTAVLAEGNEAAICYGRGPLVEGKNIYRFSPQWEVYFHALMTRITGLTGCYSPVATHNLLKFIRQYQPDVVHIHEMHGYFVNYGPVIRYLKTHHIRTVWTFHCEFMYTGKCGYAYDCQKWKTGCGSCPNLGEYVSTKWFDFTHHMWKRKKALLTDWKELTIVTPSQWLADRSLQSFLKEIPTKVIHNSINTDIFYPRSYDHLKKKHGLKDEKIVLSVAPDIMCQRKGGKHVLQLAQMMIDQNIRFIMIGFKPEEVTTLSFPSNVIPLARTTNQEELAEYYSMADVFVICSEKENYPTTCVEAVACGTPVCGFDTGGTKETYPGHDENFVPYGEIDSLSVVIHKTIEKKSICCDESEPMTAQYLNLYR